MCRLGIPQASNEISLGIFSKGKRLLTILIIGSGVRCFSVKIKGMHLD